MATISKNRKVKVKKQEEKPEIKKSPELSYTDRLEWEKKLAKINQELVTMRYMDLQRACIVRGMDFMAMVASDIHGLHSWVTKNWENTQDNNNLTEFDTWRKKFLEERSGKKDEPYVRLAYFGEVDEATGEPEIIKPERVKKSKKKRERDTENGLFKGTKKALTFQCIKEGKDIKETIKVVTKAFPDAKEKSIKIWAKKAIK